MVDQPAYPDRFGITKAGCYTHMSPRDMNSTNRVLKKHIESLKFLQHVFTFRQRLFNHKRFQQQIARPTPPFGDWPWDGNLNSSRNPTEP